MKRKIFIAILTFSFILMGCTSDISSKDVENQAGNDIQAEDLKIAVNEYLEDQNNRRALKTIKKFDKDLVISELSRVILEATQQEYSVDLHTFVTIRQCKDLYESAFGENCSILDKNSELAEKLGSLYNEQKELKASYPFNIEKGATSYQYIDVYVIKRMEYSYESNILGKISKEIDSYKPQNDSYWGACNVEYDAFLGQYPGDERYIIYSSEVNPFSKDGVYNIAYYQDGTTLPLEDTNGFQSDTLVLYLINEEQLGADWNRYQDSKSESEKLLAEIAQLNGGGQVSNDAPKDSVIAEKEIKQLNSDNEYILPESDKRYLTESDLAGLDQATLRLARNEIYARHGRAYETKDLNEYFSQQSWYHGYLSAAEFDNSVLNEYERANVELIRSIENSMSENEKIESNSHSIAVEDIFPSDWTQITSWHSYSTGYYMIPEATDGEPVIYFSIENNTISASLAYGVLIDSIEQNEQGGLVCIGRMYPYTKSFGTGGEEDYNGTVEITWYTWDTIDFPSISMIDGHQMTDFSMIADDYCYSGFIE